MISLLNTTLSMAVRMSTPYLFAALGGMIAQHSGVYNFALEGMMLGGAFFGYLFALTTGSLLVGVMGAVLCGLFFGLLFSFVIMRFGVSQMVLGLGFNTLMLGITSFGQRLLNMGKDVRPHLPNTIGDIPSGFLKNIPVIGGMLFGQNLFVYVVIAFYVYYAWFLNRTRVGLGLRSVGESPTAAQSAGVNVFRYRYVAVVVSCILPALGGAYLTLTQVGRFAEGMTDGRGWIAIAALCLGRLRPGGVFFSSLLFGLASALSNQVQVLNIGVPSHISLMLPYVLAILVLVSSGKQRSHGPAALGKPYFKNR